METESARWYIGWRKEIVIRNFFTSMLRRGRGVWLIILDDGRTVEDEGEILAAVTNFYQELFTSHAGNNMDDLLLCVEAKVTPYMNN